MKIIITLCVILTCATWMSCNRPTTYRPVQVVYHDGTIDTVDVISSGDRYIHLSRYGCLYDTEFHVVVCGVRKFKVLK